MPPQSIAAVVGARVKEIRDRKSGMSQVELAAGLKKLGIELAQPLISGSEAGRRELNVSEWLGIARVLGVSPLALLVPDETERAREDDSDIVEVAGEYFDGPKLRDWLRGWVPPPWAKSTEARKAYYDALPLDEYRALQVAGAERLVIWVTDRLLRALGNRDDNDELRDPDFAFQLLEDIERFTKTIRDAIRDEITEKT